MDQWFNINTLHCNLPYILVLFITHFSNEKCDKNTHPELAVANENINMQSCDHNSTLSFLLPFYKEDWCVWKIAVQCIYVGPWSTAYTETYIWASAKAQLIWGCAKHTSWWASAEMKTDTCTLNWPRVWHGWIVTMYCLNIWMWISGREVEYRKVEGQHVVYCKGLFHDKGAFINYYQGATNKLGGGGL